MYAPRPPMASCETNKPRTLHQKVKCLAPISLRLCLLAWAYLRMVVSILWSSVTLIYIVQAFIPHPNGIILRNDPIPYVFEPLIFLPQIMEMAMIVTFIVAGHKKSVKLYRVYFYYCIISLLVYFITSTVCFFLDIELVYFFMNQYLTFHIVELYTFGPRYDDTIFGVTFILDICLEIMLILLVKRQIRRYSRNIDEGFGNSEECPVNA